MADEPGASDLDTDDDPDDPGYGNEQLREWARNASKQARAYRAGQHGLSRRERELRDWAWHVYRTLRARAPWN